jgi:3-hydroxyisobutyrate dehydrogenase
MNQMSLESLQAHVQARAPVRAMPYGPRKIGFIGLGLMGLPMAENLIKAGHAVKGMEVDARQKEKLIASGGTGAASVADAVADADVVISMLPDLQHVREIYLRKGGVIATARKDALLIDCSTIDVESARMIAEAAERRGLAIVDAPTSGGVGNARVGKLTFMVGGPFAAFERAKSILAKMGQTIVHAGPAGNGQAAKLCNNLILGASMIAVSEAFVLAERLGLDGQKLFDIASKSSGQCWAITSYCPVPGLVPNSPANSDYRAGFSAALMLRDLKLAQEAARAAGSTTDLGDQAARMFSQYVDSGSAERDFSGIIEYVRGNSRVEV